jgi:LysR family transcriptional regulator, carnitine catabolism transcriptional activator
MNADLRQLRVFVAVAQLGNFTRAAERLNLSQPSLSLHMRQLEKSLGVRLLDRSTRAVSLTRAGEDFLPVAERLLEDFQQAVRSVADLAAHRRGRVVVSVLPSVAADLLPRALAVLREKYPGIAVSIRDEVAEQIVARVRSGEADFGVGAIDGLAPDVTGVPLLRDELLAVIPREHPLARVAKPTWRALARYPFVAMSRDSSVRRLTDQAFAQNGLTAAPAYEAKYMSSAIGLVGQGLGVAALPSSARLMVEQAGLHHARLTDPVMRRQIGVLSRQGRSLSPAAQALVGILRTPGAP